MIKKHIKHIIRWLSFVALSISLTSCHFINIYTPKTQQGNIITEKQMNLLHTGLTKVQVKYIMGNPILNNPFNDDIWHYVHYIKHKQQRSQYRKVTLYFESNILTKIDDSINSSKT